MGLSGGESREPLRRALATVLGVGHAPLAPGTAGAAVGTVLAALLATLGGGPALAAGALVALVAGWWASAEPERRWGAADPPVVVVDELAGQLVAVIGLADGWRGLLLGFVLFRVFDVWKPWPIRRLEALPGGSGIMADDLAAGIYASLAQHLLRWAAPGLWGTP